MILPKIVNSKKRVALLFFIFLILSSLLVGIYFKYFSSQKSTSHKQKIVEGTPTRIIVDQGVDPVTETSRGENIVIVGEVSSINSNSIEIVREGYKEEVSITSTTNALFFDQGLPGHSSASYKGLDILSHLEQGFSITIDKYHNNGASIEADLILVFN